jgi:hypothetical protein
MTFALIPQVYAQNIVGTITNPIRYGDVSNASGGFTGFLTNILRLVFVIGGIYALINFIIAGFQYMGAGGDTKATTAAWNRIWQTLLGLVVMVAAFAIAAIAGWIIFGNPGFLLNPVIYGP